MIRFLPLLIILAIIGLLGWRMASGVDPSLVQTLQIGRTLPAISLTDITTNKPVALATLPKPLLVNIFASWCAPCHVEHPHLMALHAHNPALPIIGIAYKDTPAAIKNYLRKYGNPYTIILTDPKGSFGLELGLTGIPESFTIDQMGKITAHFPGPFNDYAQLEMLAKGAR